MRLYLSGKSKKNLGYTPDWLKVTYNENGQELELTLDIKGEIDYSTDCINCRCKGVLVPWTLYNQKTGDEMVLSEMDEDIVDKMYPTEKLATILRTGKYFRIGLYPTDDTEDGWKSAEEDSLSNCICSCELYDDINDKFISIEFEVEADLND